MLSVGVHKHQNIPRRSARAVFNGRAVAQAVGMIQHRRAGVCGQFAGIIVRTVIDQNNFSFGIAVANVFDENRHTGGFIATGNDNAQFHKSSRGVTALCIAH